MHSNICRLCGGEVDFRFSKNILNKYDVKYFECQSCHSLQSEQPFWLEEAYCEQSQYPDIRALSRVMETQADVFLLAKILGLTSKDALLDWGGGNGMLTRLLRDIGLACYRYDLYIKNYYALGYDHPAKVPYKMVMAFQVWEHFDDAADEVDKMFLDRPEYVLISTGLYCGQDHNWEYLNAYGRHIFLFSLQAREFIAEKYGYQMLNGRYTLFYKGRLNPLKHFFVRLLFSGRFSSFRRALFNGLPKSSELSKADREYAFQKFYFENRVGEVNGP
jgi:hypothetical protein